jgi:hypothetical protein
MPTDLEAVFRRKREAQDEMQTLVTIMLVCLIIFLGMFGLVVEVRDCAVLGRISRLSFMVIARSPDCHESARAIIS